MTNLGYHQAGQDSQQQGGVKALARLGVGLENDAVQALAPG
jgi:hypothetical protein